MPKFAYIARTNAGTPTNTPTGWPYGWNYPADGNSTPYPDDPTSGGNIIGIPWPPLWPQTVVAGTDVVIADITAISIADPFVFLEAEIQINGGNAGTEVYLNHLMEVTCAEISAETGVRKISKTAGGYTDAIYFKVSNYTGSKYGFGQTIYFDTTNWTAADIMEITVKLVTVTANPDGTDQWEVAY